MAELDDWPDIAGRMDGQSHVLPIRVYFEDTDFSGVVYHASYLKFCERGRSDYMRQMGIHHAELFEPVNGQQAARAFAVRHMDIDFLGAAKIDDILQVRTSVQAMTGARLTLKQDVFCDDRYLLKAVVTVVMVDNNGRPKRFPNTLLTNLSDYIP